MAVPSKPVTTISIETPTKKAVTPWPTSTAGTGSGGLPWSREQLSILGDSQTKFIAARPQDVQALLKKLGVEDASLADGPLAAAMMVEAHLLPKEVDLRRFWLLDMRENLQLVEKLLPHEEFDWIVRMGSPAQMDFIGNPLLAGDLIYLVPEREEGYGKYVFVHRVNSTGATYAITNVYDEVSQGYRIEEVPLYDPAQPGTGYLATDGSITSSRSMVVWRKRDYSTMSPAEERLNRVLNRGGSWMVVVKEAGSDIEFARDADIKIHPASVIKVVVGMLLFESFGNPSGQPTDFLLLAPPKAGRTYDQLLRAMLVQSEETATDLLITDLRARMGDEKIHTVLETWGLTETSIEPRWTTAREMANLLEGLFQGRYLPGAANQYLLDLMAQRTENDSVRLWKMEPVLPQGYQLFNKRGSLTNPVIVADSGILVLPDGQAFILCLFGYADDWTTFEELDTILGDFALEWYRSQIQIK